MLKTHCLIVMIAQVTPVAFNHVGWKFYLTFAICGFTNALFFWALMPETRGIPLEELDTYFESMPLFVPGTQGAEGYDASTRERELAEGRVVVRGKEQDLERGGTPIEKAHLEHYA
jgi:hypothetical protein